MATVAREAAELARDGRTASRRSSLWREAFSRLKKKRLAMGGLVFLLVMAAVCLIGPFFSPYASGSVNTASINKPPSLAHWLGTDNLGRDILTRMMQAGRISLTVGIASMVLSVTIGTVLGALAGFYRGWVDQLIMRLADVLMTIPGLPLLFIWARCSPSGKSRLITASTS